MSKFDLNKHTARLLMREPFFAGISRRVDKTASNAIPTAGVRLNKATGYFEMLYNPEFFEKLTDVQKLESSNMSSITLSFNMSLTDCQ